MICPLYEKNIFPRLQAELYIQGESKKTDTFDIQMNNKGVSFFWLTLYIPRIKKYAWLHMKTLHFLVFWYTVIEN
jgi:hypothetical protein